MRLLGATALCAALMLAACAAPQALTPGPGLSVTTDRDLPPPTGREVAAMARVYQVAPFDQLKVGVFGIEELNQTIRADAQGVISLPLVGSVHAAGLTLEQVSGQIAQRLRRYVRDPQVSVNLEETVSQTMTVSGSVADPGQFPVVGNMTLVRAIARAKGETDVANTRDVVVFRTVDGQRMAALYNLDAIRRGIYADPRIYPDDIIQVGDSPGRRLFKSILQVSPLLVTPVVVLLQRL